LAADPVAGTVPRVVDASIGYVILVDADKEASASAACG
jgi:hypothetical protein